MLTTQQAGNTLVTTLHVAVFIAGIYTIFNHDIAAGSLAVMLGLLGEFWHLMLIDERRRADYAGDYLVYRTQMRIAEYVRKRLDQPAIADEIADTELFN